MAKEHIPSPEPAAFVGLDWADQQHAVCLQVAGSTQVESDVIEHTPEAMHQWVDHLRQRFGGRPVAIALEQSRGAVIDALKMHDFLVLHSVNPAGLALYRQAFFSSGAKDDPVDASLLLELLVRHRDRLRVWAPDDPLTRELALLVEHRRTTVDERTRLTNRLTSLLKGYFPQALSWAGALASLQACDFLLRWPTLSALQQARPSVVRQFYRRHGCRRPEVIQRRLQEIRAACPLTNDPALIKASRVMALSLASQIRCLTVALQVFDQQLKEVFGQHPDRALFESFPGAGAALAPRLLAAMGSDRDRYGSASEVQQLYGIAPVTQRSGQSWWVHWRWACPTFARQSFHEFAKQSIKWSPWARAYYDQQRERGARHHAAVRALAYKWIRVIYRCWKDRQLYDEQLYLEALRRRHSPLVARLNTLALKKEVAA